MIIDNWALSGKVDKVKKDRLLMRNTPVVITSIYPYSPAIQRFIHLGNKVILIGDIKTPTVKSNESLIYLSIDDQIKQFGVFAKQLPVGHYGRKNIGYIIAMKMADAIIETDDDNYPYDFFPNFKKGNITTKIIKSKSGFVNTYGLFAKGKKQSLWPRGFPLSLINAKNNYSARLITGNFPLQQGLTDKDGDFDGIYRLTNNAPVFFKKNIHLTLSSHTYAPINSQNTFWTKEAFLYLYLPCFVSGRVCDIYRGYIAQRLLWETGKTALFISPGMYQNRNPHNYFSDFKEELPLYNEAEKIIAILESLSLKGSFESKMIQIYEAFVNAGLLPKEELNLLQEWIKIVSPIIKKDMTRG